VARGLIAKIFLVAVSRPILARNKGQGYPMQLRTIVVGMVVAGTLAQAPAAWAQTAPRAQLSAHILPIAAGALVGAAASFFVLPLIVPATAVAATAGASATASPVLAVVGAGIGGFLGYELAH
jgi:hypothetical protein